jgi:hypothetical protein
MNGPTIYGDTCPYLNIAKEHNVDYTAVLVVAHHETYDKWPPGDYDEHLDITLALPSGCYADILAQVYRFFELRTALA